MKPISDPSIPTGTPRRKINAPCQTANNPAAVTVQPIKKNRDPNIAWKTLGIINLEDTQPLLMVTLCFYACYIAI